MIIEHKNLSHDRFKTTFKNLLPAETYNVTVMAVAQSKMRVSESEGAAITIATLPRPPAFIYLISACLHSVNITWNVPTIAKNAQIVDYIVKSKVLDSNGSKSILGTEKSQSSLTMNQATVRGLAQGTTYGIQIKVSLNSNFFNKNNTN